MEANRVNIGELDTLVTFYSVERGIGDQGQKTTQRTQHCRLYAKLEPLTDEYVSDDNLEARTSLSVTTYKVAGMNIRWQLEINGVDYEIKSIDPISRWSPLCVITAATIEK